MFRQGLCPRVKIAAPHGRPSMADRLRAGRALLRETPATPAVDFPPSLPRVIRKI